MAAKDNRVSGSMYLLYMRAKGAAKTDNKLVMCQTDFSINRSKNMIESNTKCGRSSVAGNITRDATVSGELAMPVLSGSQDYVDIKQLQDYFESDDSYSFTLMPKDGSTLSTGKLQVIDFDGKFTSDNETYPTEGNATFETGISIDDKPVYSDYVPTT